ncbi:MAG: hypothetical protein E7634_07960 [Ruminococcaceae bacterium]|nr:hypothetical protein [Oscillospiraceae bacterium]
MKQTIARIISLTLIAVMLLSALSACTVKPYYEGAPEGMRPINEGEEKAILYVPENWLVDTSTGVPTGYYSTNDRSMVTLVTVKADALNGQTIPEYWASYVDSFITSVKDFKIVKETESASDYTTRLIAERSTYVYDFTATVTGLEYKFRQALLTHPDTGDLYIITYSTVSEVFDTHLSDLTEIYNNFKFVTEKIPMNDKIEVSLPEDATAPEGYKTVSSEFVDYLLYIPSDWTPLINTGMTAAHAPESKSINVNAMAFNTTLASLDEYWTGYENDLAATFGEVTYADPQAKYQETKLDGYDARKYVYSLSVNDKAYDYQQYMVIKGGYIYLLTFCSPADVSAPAAEFDGIVSNFKFK